MSDPDRRFEFRCPVHGFIPIDEWERDIIHQDWFQRLRRIRQLAWTDQVYPGAMHTRFEHTLGVMHAATQLFDGIVQRSRPLLTSELSYREAGLERHRVLVRLAALLHDVGHGPFSHGGEDLLPRRGHPLSEGTEDNRPRYKHEDYSAAIVRLHFRDVIDQHDMNAANYGLKAEEVAALIEGSPGAGNALFWRSLISGQMDADRMDYLLRDSTHIGVEYGRFDFRRLINTIQVVVAENQLQRESDEHQSAPEAAQGGNPALRIGVSEGGWHAVESLILARYLMFTQVYFHKTRVAYDHHLREALRVLLPDGTFPPPTDQGLAQFKKWDDWRVLGALADGQGGDHGERLASRNHYREVFHTPETPREDDLAHLERVRVALGDKLACTERAEKSWYKLEQPEDILIAQDGAPGRVKRLSEHSSVVRSLTPNRQVLLYSRPELAGEARQVANEVTRDDSD